MTNEKKRRLLHARFWIAVINYKERYEWSSNGWRCELSYAAEKAKAGTGLADRPTALCNTVTLSHALFDTHTLSKIETRASIHGVR